MVSPLWFYSEKKRCFNGVPRVAKNGFPTAKGRFFYSGFTMRNKEFQWYLKGEKQSVSTRKKGVCPQWFYSHKKDVSTVFKRLQKKLFRR